MSDAKSPIKVYLKRGNCWGVRTDHGGVDWIPIESNRPPSEFTPCEAQYELQRILRSTAANSNGQSHTFNGKHEPMLPSKIISKSTDNLCTQRTFEKTDVAQTPYPPANLRNQNQPRSTELEDLEGKSKVSDTSQTSSQEATEKALKNNGLLYNPRIGIRKPSSPILGLLTQFISNYLYFPEKKVLKKIKEIKSRNEIESNKLSKDLRKTAGEELYTEKIQEEAHKIWELRLKNTRDSDKRTDQDDWDDAKESLNKSSWQRFCQWTGIGKKTGWEILVVTSIPILGIVLTQSFTKLNNLQQQNIADEKQKDEVLKNYFDGMKSLLLDKEHPLRQSKENDESRSIATTLTEAALRQLSANQDSQSSSKSGNDRKGLVIRFLAETDLIEKSDNSDKPIVPLSRADLSGADLSGVDLSGAVLGYTNLKGADLSKAILDKADFKWEKTIHIGDYDLSYPTDLSGANLSEASIKDANFSNVYLDGAILSDAYLGGTTLSEAKLRGAILSNANLSRASLEKANLSGASLKKANLNWASLENANLSGVNLSDAILTNAVLRTADLSYANFNCANLSKAILSYADLSYANLNCANLSNTVLRNTTFKDANLKDTNFSGAILLMTDLRNAKNLTQAQLETCPPLLCNVALPTGFRVDSNRDCDRIPQELKSRYPQGFKTVEDAKKIVDEVRQEKWN